jgi:salicylate hydroxylase
MWVLCDREPVKTWSAGNIVLVGDAAHPMLQYLGQGTGTSLEDAVCLAAEISKSGGDLPGAFHAYTERRYLRTGRAQIMARVYGEVYHASRVARELRNGMLSQQKIPELYESWSWLYDYDC